MEGNIPGCGFSQFLLLNTRFSNENLSQTSNEKRVAPDLRQTLCHVLPVLTTTVNPQFMGRAGDRHQHQHTKVTATGRLEVL